MTEGFTQCPAISDVISRLVSRGRASPLGMPYTRTRRKVLVKSALIIILAGTHDA